MEFSFFRKFKGTLSGFLLIFQNLMKRIFNFLSWDTIKLPKIKTTLNGATKSR
jgi:hypothetical protein